VSGTPTSILADGAAVFFSFLKLAPAGGWFGFSVCEGSFGRGRNGRAFFLRAGSRVGWEGGSRGGSGRLFRFARAGPRFAGESRFYSLLLRVAIGFTPVFNTFVRFHKFDSVNDGRKS
jgi:hypothetical protein